MRIFHYYDGQTVEVGDRVRIEGRAGVVIEIIQPGTEMAKAFQASEGGILIDVGWGPHSGILLTPPDGICWEDVELIERAGK